MVLEPQEGPASLSCMWKVCPAQRTLSGGGWSANCFGVLSMGFKLRNCVVPLWHSKHYDQNNCKGWAYGIARSLWEVRGEAGPLVKLQRLNCFPGAFLYSPALLSLFSSVFMGRGVDFIQIKNFNGQAFNILFFELFLMMDCGRGLLLWIVQMYICFRECRAVTSLSRLYNNDSNTNK